jgi:DNA invertase Pin-like site-specific DNA recombinase
MAQPYFGISRNKKPDDHHVPAVSGAGQGGTGAEAAGQEQGFERTVVDTTTAHGKLVFGMFALMAEYEAALIQERTQAGLIAARARGRHGGRKPKMSAELIGKAQRMYDSRQFTMNEIAQYCHVTPMTIYRHINTRQPAPETGGVPA